jgi:hypothetical protein
MAQSLLAIAAYIAVVGGIIFGVSRYEKSGKKEDSIELVSLPSFETEPDRNVQLISEPISEPVAPEEATEDSTETTETSNEALILPVIQGSELLETLSVADEIEPREEVFEVTIPPTIQDPKRPNDSKVEDLTQEILAWGQSKDLKHVAKLIQYATHADPIVRSHVATALGQIVSAHPLRGDVERSIPVLGKLTNDPDLKVRLYAVQSLGTIRSEKVLPYLEKALLSPSGSVMKAANSALQNLKLYYGKTPSMQIAEQMLEKRKKA